MPARINNLPANAVYDQTPVATLSYSIVVSGGGTHTLVSEGITGTLQDTRDKDLTTAWQANPTFSAGSGSNTYTITMLYDCNKVIWNCLIYIKWALGNSVDVSSNGTDWTQLTDTGGTQTYGVFSFRYLRFVSELTDASPDLDVYEVKIMGA